MLNNNQKKLKIVHRRMFSQDSKKRTSTTDDNSVMLDTSIRKKTNFIITPNRARTPTQKYRIYARDNSAKRHFERPPINRASKNDSISFLFEIERKVKIIQRVFRRYLERKAEEMKLMNITVNSINTDSIDISSDGFSID